MKFPPATSKLVYLDLVSLAVAKSRPNGVKVAFRRLQESSRPGLPAVRSLAALPTVLKLWQTGLLRFPQIDAHSAPSRLEMCRRYQTYPVPFLRRTRL